MLLTLTSTTVPARDLGHLLRKHPDRLQTFALMCFLMIVPIVAAAAQVHVGRIDALGIPVYPNVIPGKGTTILRGALGGASYATRDGLSAVVAWYRDRLGALGFAAPRGAALQVWERSMFFTRGSDSVMIVRDRPDGLTVIVERVHRRR